METDCGSKIAVRSRRLVRISLISAEIRIYISELICTIIVAVNRLIYDYFYTKPGRHGSLNKMHIQPADQNVGLRTPLPLDGNSPVFCTSPSLRPNFDRVIRQINTSA